MFKKIEESYIFLVRLVVPLCTFFPFISAGVTDQCHYFYIRNSLMKGTTSNVLNLKRYRASNMPDMASLRNAPKNDYSQFVENDIKRLDIGIRLMSQIPGGHPDFTQNLVFEFHRHYMIAKANLESYRSKSQLFDLTELQALEKKLNEFESIADATKYFEKLEAAGFRLVPKSTEIIKASLEASELQTLSILRESWHRGKQIIGDSILAGRDDMQPIQRRIVNFKERHAINEDLVKFLPFVNSFLRDQILKKYTPEKYDLEAVIKFVDEISVFLKSDFFQSLQNFNKSSIVLGVRSDAKELDVKITEFNVLASRLMAPKFRTRLTVVGNDSKDRQ
ncbi:MAG: hypothetical protein JNL11_10120 [Bdellovibrionaceae bacterium]|nr:hypothetical protein [Pseudobdellovibrionaceae bacterium]